MYVEKSDEAQFLKKKSLQNNLLFVSKIGVFGHFLEIASLDFTNFAYFNRQEWYLADLGGCSLQKKIIVSFLAYESLSPNYFFVSKFNILTFTQKFFFVLHIMIDNNDF